VKIWKKNIQNGFSYFWTIYWVFHRPLQEGKREKLYEVLAWGYFLVFFYGKPHAFCGENRVSEGLRWLSWSSQGPLRYEETSKKS